VRRRRGVSQATIAAALEVSQPNVSRIEQEDDVYLSTLARYVAALGGHLEVRAVFPEETITLLRDPAGDAGTPDRDE
jgi:DNA-binding XRE family transcriptional regulator